MFFFARYESRDLNLSELKGRAANISAGGPFGPRGFVAYTFLQMSLRIPSAAKRTIHQRQVWIDSASSCHYRSRAYSVEKLYLLARAKNLRALQATETTRHEGALPEGAHVSPRSCVGLGACRERIESLERTRQRNHVIADLVFFNRIGQ